MTFVDVSADNGVPAGELSDDALADIRTHALSGNRRAARRSAERRASARSIAIGATLAVLVLAVAGCGSSTTPSTSSASTSAAVSASSSASATSSAAGASSSSSSSSYPAGKEQVCQARDELTKSITAVTNPGLLAGGTPAIEAAVAQVKTDLGAVATAGKQDYEPQVTAMQSALQQLETAVGDLGDGNTSANLQEVGTAIAAIGVASEALFTQLRTACGS